MHPRSFNYCSATHLTQLPEGFRLVSPLKSALAGRNPTPRPANPYIRTLIICIQHHLTADTFSIAGIAYSELAYFAYQTFQIVEMLLDFWAKTQSFPPIIPLFRMYVHG